MKTKTCPFCGCTIDVEMWDMYEHIFYYHYRPSYTPGDDTFARWLDQFHVPYPCCRYPDYMEEKLTEFIHEILNGVVK